MAGIGFELKKLFVGRGAIRKLRAYAYASIICAGTMMLAFILLICVQQLAKAYGAPQRTSELLIVLMVYALGGSLLLSSIFQMLLSRFVADQIYEGAVERVMPSMMGGTVALMIPGGLIYGAFLLRAVEVPVLDRVLNWALFMELIVVWLQMSYITAVHDYKKILLGFTLGVLTTVGLTWILLATGVRIITSIMIALLCGYGVMLALFMRALLGYFPVGKGSLFYFIAWIGKYPDLILIGIFNMVGAYVHLIVMWFSPLGETLYGVFRHAPGHDAAAFYAFLVTLPSSINFIVSIEVKFYDRYRRYFSAVTGGGTLAEISIARDDMLAMLRLEVFKLAQIQVFAMIIYAVLMRYFLETIGFTRDMISMYQMMCVGYGAYAIGNSLVLLHLYFNDRKSALLTSGVFFATNLVISLLTRNGPSLYYDMGLLIGGIAMYVIGMICLLRYVKEIDYHVFCGQPVLAVQKKTRWEAWADKLDNAANRRAREARWRLR